MKLIFSKTEDNEIEVKLQKGTVMETFTYTEMISQLLENNDFSDTEFVDLTEEEKIKIESMLQKISQVFVEDSSDELL